MFTYPGDQKTLAVQDRSPARRRSGSPWSAAAGGAASSVLGRLASQGWEALRRARERRRTVRALSALDNRALADIGVYRGQIPAIANAAADGRDPRRGTEAKAGADNVPSRPAASGNAAHIAA